VWGMKQRFLPIGGQQITCLLAQTTNQCLPEEPWSKRLPRQRRHHKGLSVIIRLLLCALESVGDADATQSSSGQK